MPACLQCRRRRSRIVKEAAIKAAELGEWLSNFRSSRSHFRSGLTHLRRMDRGRHSNEGNVTRHEVRKRLARSSSPLPTVCLSVF